MISSSSPEVTTRRPRYRDDIIDTDICVIGAGSGGLSVTAGAVQMGASVVLVEKGKMGGECLNTGCVPSKALIAAAHTVDTIRSSSLFGMQHAHATVDLQRVHAHVRGVISAIAPHDSVERFEALGVTVINATARFLGPTELEAGSQKIRARRFVIATGSTAAVPPISGLPETPYLTNESIFELNELPAHLIVIGGGPIGIEIAQSFRRLGARVTVIERFGLLAKDEPEAVDVVRRSLFNDSISMHENTSITNVAHNGTGIDVHIEMNPGIPQVISGSHLLVAAGRKPNMSSLGLDVAGVATTPSGITVDPRLRTSNKHIFAIGDVASGPQFTHIAAYHAGIVIRSSLFGLPAKVNYRALPWVTYCDLELAHVGLTEAEAQKTGEAVAVLVTPLSAIDRAQTDHETEGLAKIVLGQRGKIRGATIVGPHAGEMISLWGLAIANDLKVGAIAQLIVPYPTLSEISKRTAGSFFTPTLFSARTRSFVRFIQRFIP